MYTCIYFKIHELAHPQIIKDIGEKNTWRRLNEFALIDIDYIRAAWFEKYGSGIYINRLDLGIDSRGLRPPNDPDGSFYSTHKQGTTFDLEPVNGKLRELYEFIIDLIKKGELIFLNTLENFEDTLKWVHAGYMNTHEKPLIIHL